MTAKYQDEDEDQDRRQHPPSARRNGLSYKRYSDPKQGKGDSEGRQDDDYRSFCRRHNLTPLALDDHYTDRGRSGYHDEHRKKGRLGKLVVDAKDGRFEPGTVIVIEMWDRLGRLIPNKQIDLIEELLETGVDIGICRLDDIFTMADFGTHKWTTLAVFVQLAYQESKLKSERIGAAWESRRRRAREKGEFMAGSLPAWLQLVNGKIVPIPEHVAAVQRIFELSGSGYGIARIIRTLIEQGVQPIGRTGRWSHAYIALLLNDRRVLGALQPHKGRKARGGVLEDYYPRIIDDKVFNLARAGQDGRRGKGGKRDRRYVNTFQGLLKSALDGEGFQLRNRTTEKDPRLTLANTAGKNGRGRTQTIPYLVFEEAILAQLAEVKPADVLPRPRAGQLSTVEVLRAKLKNIRADIAGFEADLREGHSRRLTDLLRDKEKEEENVAGLLQDELAKSVRPAEKAWKQLPSLVGLVREQGDLVRLKIRGVLRDIIEDARLLLVRRQSYILAAVQFHFLGGAVRHYLVVYKQACRGRPEGRWRRSLNDVVKLGPLDLRRAEDVAQLEGDLRKLDLEWLTGEMKEWRP
jgi:DNA invertase Pin-like site-specific DNA recombinase